MSEKIVQLNEEVIKGQIKGFPKTKNYGGRQRLAVGAGLPVPCYPPRKCLSEF